jgi:hypothetical protein
MTITLGYETAVRIASDTLRQSIAWLKEDIAKMDDPEDIAFFEADLAALKRAYIYYNGETLDEPD